jgi:hypothetical protein
MRHARGADSGIGERAGPEVCLSTLLERIIQGVAFELGIELRLISISR